MPQRPITIFAPAKINLYLHITGKLDDGYHTLDSLVNFTDIGDEILIEPADHFDFTINGPFAVEFPIDARQSTDSSTNLIVKAVFALAKKIERLPDFKITLTKNLPLASGIGGGSSNAAAALWGMIKWWDLNETNMPWLQDIFLQLGADVPICYYCQPAIMRGIGENLTPAPQLPPCHIVLINPRKLCSTQTIFQSLTPPYSEQTIVPPKFSTLSAFIEFLKLQKNDMQDAACHHIAEIHEILKSLENQDQCLLSRMSGSGATCFGLFPDENTAAQAMQSLQKEYPKFWIQSGMIGDIQRY